MEPSEETAGRGGPDETGGGEGVEDISNLSVAGRIVVALTLAVVTVGAAVHLGMVFLHVAPPNTVSKQHDATIDAWVYPEFEQNWKLFAPDPVRQNIHVQVRAETLTEDGELEVTGWTDLTEQDTGAIRGSLAPSHTRQNQLRRAWSYYTGSHDEDNRPEGDRGLRSESYIRRIAEQRYLPRPAGGAVQRIQLRSVTTAIPAPPWSGEKTDTAPVHQELPWWIVEEGRS